MKRVFIYRAPTRRMVKHTIHPSLWSWLGACVGQSPLLSPTVERLPPSLERCGLRPPQGKGGAFPLWGGREIQNPVSDRHPVGHLGPQLAGIRYLGSQKGVKKVCLGLEGSSTARHLGPPPRIDLKFGSMDACRSRAARGRRVLRSWRPLRPLILSRRARDVRAQRDRPML